MSVEFHDNRIQVKEAFERAAIQFLEEAGTIMTRQVADNTRVGTGETAGKWTYVVDDDKMECTVGNPLENALWEEFGTGEFALNRNGRRGGWFYKDDKGKWHHTYGKTPTRALHNAFVTKKGVINRRAKEIFKGLK